MALFSERSTTRFRVVLAVIASGVIGAPLLLMWWVRSEIGTERTNPRQQPVEFDHRHHVKDDGIACLYCHREAERSRYAGVPAADVCMGCHGQIWNDSTLLEPVRRSFYDDVSIEWERVHDLADFVYFDHSAHVTRGVDCSACHGDVASMPRVYKVVPMTMGWCLDCHRNPGSRLQMPEARLQKLKPPTYCSGCHR